MLTQMSSEVLFGLGRARQLKMPALTDLLAPIVVFLLLSFVFVGFLLDNLLR
jgi:hypothetical protein